MAFKRALWHSGLTYRQTCDACGTVVQYTDHNLDFRPWFADGFVYCPKCKKPLRHGEHLAIDNDGRQQETIVLDPNTRTSPSVTTESASSNSEPAFCTQCGRALGAGDRFCAGCGQKRS